MYNIYTLSGEGVVMYNIYTLSGEGVVMHNNGLLNVSMHTK
jgi:hypothetical protein